MLLGVKHRRGKGEVHLMIAKPQRFLGERLFLGAGRHLRQPLRSQQWRLIHNGRLRCPSVCGLGIHRGRACRLSRTKQSVGNCTKQRNQHNRGNFLRRLHRSQLPALHSSTQGDNPGVVCCITFAICTVLKPGESAKAVSTKAPTSSNGCEKKAKPCPNRRRIPLTLNSPLSCPSFEMIG